MHTFVIFVLTLLLYPSPSSGQGSYVHPGFPASLDVPWRHINPRQIDCQFIGGDISSYSQMAYDVAFFDEKKVVDVEEVTLCSIWSFETSCYEHWYLTTDVTHVRRPLHAKLNDCLTEIMNGELSPSHLPDENYPDPECYWLKTYTTAKKVVHLQRIRIHFDYYTDSLVDHRLLNGKCGGRYCEGTSDNVLIIRHSNYKDHCNSWTWDQAYISDHMIKVRKSGVEYYIEQTCDLTFCGKVGKRLSHGLFMHVPEKSAHWAIKRTSPCSGKDAKISNNPVIARELKYEGDKEGFELYRDCLSAKDLIVLTNQVTPHLLSQIAPMTGWYKKGDIYRFINGSLQVASGLYRTLEGFPANGPEGCLIGDGQTRCFSFFSWIFDQEVPPVIPTEYRNKTINLINGIVLTSKGTFSYPSNWKWIQIQNHELSQMDPAPIQHFVEDHPVFQKESLTEIKIVQTRKHFNISDLFSGSWYRKLAWSIIFIVILVILLIIFYKIAKCALSRRLYFSTAELRMTRRNNNNNRDVTRPKNVF